MQEDDRPGPDVGEHRVRHRARVGRLVVVGVDRPQDGEHPGARATRRVCSLYAPYGGRNSRGRGMPGAAGGRRSASLISAARVAGGERRQVGVVPRVVADRVAFGDGALERQRELGELVAEREERRLRLRSACSVSRIRWVYGLGPSSNVSATLRVCAPATRTVGPCLRVRAIAAFSSVRAASGARARATRAAPAPPGAAAEAR